MSFFSSFVSAPKQSFSNSIFGFVDKKVKELSSILSGSVDITTEEYKFPEIVIVGDEKNGKSSLLENITKCKIFPKDRGYCTKRPIRFILRNADKISFSVSFSKGKKTFCKTDDEICKLITEEFSSGLSIEEIVVECSAPGNHNFEFVDLPGIKAYPEEMATSTKAITEHYLANKNNVIMLAYAATTASEANCSTLSLLKKHGRQKDTVFVMTMLDKLGDAEDVKFANSQKFPDFENKFYVISNGADEASWFKNNGITGNVTASNLLTYTQTLFTDYVNKNWYKNIIANLEKQKVALVSKHSNLNPLTENDANFYIAILHATFRSTIENTNIPNIFTENYKKLITSKAVEVKTPRVEKDVVVFRNYSGYPKKTYPTYEEVTDAVVVNLAELIKTKFFEKLTTVLRDGNAYNISLFYSNGCRYDKTLPTHGYKQYSDALANFKESMGSILEPMIRDYVNDSRNKSLFVDVMKFYDCIPGAYINEVIQKLKSDFHQNVIDFTSLNMTKVNDSIVEEQNLINKDIVSLTEKIAKLSAAK